MMLPSRNQARRFTLFDAITLVAAVALGLAWVQAYQRSMRAIAAATGGAVLSFSVPIRYFGPIAPFLATLAVCLFGLRLLQPRPTRRQLARSLGFAALASSLLGLIITAATVAISEAVATLGRGSSTVYLFHITMRTVNYSAPVVAGAWLVLALSGRPLRRTGRDWIEFLAISVGMGWLLLFIACQVF
jgi:hypothetical protein